MSNITKRMKAKRARREQAPTCGCASACRGRAERPRLSVYKSLRYIYAQVIDDERGVTLAQANSSDPAVREAVGKSTAGKEAAKRVGELVAERAKEKGVEKVVFDRGGYIYHGRVQALADAAREKGLQF